MYEVLQYYKQWLNGKSLKKTHYFHIRDWWSTSKPFLLFFHSNRIVVDTVSRLPYAKMRPHVLGYMNKSDMCHFQDKFLIAGCSS